MARFEKKEKFSSIILVFLKRFSYHDNRVELKQNSPISPGQPPAYFPGSQPSSPGPTMVSPSPAPTSPTNFSPILPVKSRPKKGILFLVGLVILTIVALIIIIFFKKNLETLTTKTITLTYWGLFEPPSVFQQVIDDYTKTYPKVKINYSQENLKTYRERLQAALARGEGPDIFRMHQTWVPMLGNYLSVVPSTVYDAATFEEIFYLSAKENLRRQGQYVGIPLEFDGLALFYNEDLFRAAGKVPPKTWGELKKVACEMTVKDEQGKIRTAGVAMGITSNVDHWSDIFGLMLLQNGADLTNPALCTKEGGATVGDGEVCLGRDALTFYTIFAGNQACQEERPEIGAVWDELMPSSTYAFASGSVAMYFGPSWRVFDIKQLNPSLNFKIIPVPQLEGRNISWASFWVEAVSKNSKNQKAAWEFLKYLSSKEVLQKLYQTESALRVFGEPYPRTDMASLLKGQPLVGAFIEQAANAKSWYLSSNTGDNGINEQIIKYYKDAVNAVNQGASPLSALTTAGQGVTQVLRRYGITK